MSKTFKPTEGIYRRLSVRMYGDEKFMRLSPPLPSGQSLFVYALTGPHTGPIPGVFVIGKAAMAEALGWELKAFEKAFGEVLAEGLVEFDEKTRLWFIPNAIRHNMPANPNVVLSWRGPWSLLPECTARDRIADRLFASVNALSEAFGKAFEEASGKALPKASRKHSPKQETGSSEQEAGSKKKTSSSSPRQVVPCPYEQIVSAYHEALPDLPKVRLRDGPTWADRQKAMRAVWGWVLSSRKTDGSQRAQTSGQALGWFATYFARAGQNDFVMGRTARSAEHASWRADFDFLLSKKGMKLVIEKTEVAA